MSNALRQIAEHELDRCFHDLSPFTRDELATSLVRQWIGNDGNAVIVTRDPANTQFFVQLVTDDDQWHRYPDG